jgi:DNA-binding NarL/FixJ family response regulator
MKSIPAFPDLGERVVSPSDHATVTLDPSRMTSLHRESPFDSQPQHASVLLSHPNDLIRIGLRRIFEEWVQPNSTIEVVGESSSTRGTLMAAGQLTPDVVVVAVAMPELDGIQIAERLAGPECSGPRIVLLIDVGSDTVSEVAIAALRVGVSAVVLTSSKPEELVLAVHAVTAGHAFIAPPIARLLVERFAQLPVISQVSATDSLTRRELEVLKLVAEGLSNSEIAGVLSVGEATIKYHVSQMLMKLDVRDRLQAAVFAFRSGLMVSHGEG